MGWEIVCDQAELAVECAAVAGTLGIAPAPRTSNSVWSDAASAIAAGHHVALVLTSAPTADDLVALAAAAKGRGVRLAAAMLAEADGPFATISLARDLGIRAVDEIRPLLSVIALHEAGAERPWAASLGALTPADRRRFARLTALRQSGDGAFERADGGMIAYRGPAAKTATKVGEARDVLEAVVAIHAASGAQDRVSVPLGDVDRTSVRDVLFGPARSLSDPASKSALAPYGIRMPREELCTSPSRAASEATRMGFPVSIALASPDLRVWDHPDLMVHDIDNATRVRDVFRQITQAAEERLPAARILGVTVSATTAARALLRVRASRTGEDRVLVELGFADPHGMASGDHTSTVLPTSVARIERVLGRLAGAELILAGTSQVRRQTVDAIASVLLRIGEFILDHGDAVTAVEIDPLAVLIDGSVEVREACVHVGDFYEQGMGQPGLRREAGR